MSAHRLYVGTIGEGVFRSVDGGETFRRAADGMFVECHVRALVVHPSDPRTLYLGSEQGLFVSRDGADNWQRVDSPLNGLETGSARRTSTAWSSCRPPADGLVDCWRPRTMISMSARTTAIPGSL